MSLGVKTNSICLETLKYSFSKVCCSDLGYLRGDSVMIVLFVWNSEGATVLWVLEKGNKVCI